MACRIAEKGAVEASISVRRPARQLEHGGLIHPAHGVGEDGFPGVGLRQRTPSAATTAAPRRGCGAPAGCSRALRDLARTKAGDRGDRVERRVQDELLPDMAWMLSVVSTGRSAASNSVAVAASLSVMPPSSSPITVLPRWCGRCGRGRGGRHCSWSSPRARARHQGLDRVSTLPRPFCSVRAAPARR